MIVIVISLVFLLTSFVLVMINNGSSNEIKNILDGLLIVLMSLILFKLILQSFVVTFASVKAYKGEYYRYPFTIRVLR
ncbi:DUF4870 domain-containing protein [Nostoc sp.]|uniref:DUF4870 domain-containing protein n=1 Tax=Nostoc sp. TaxID=1180 RepID=UPI002FF6C328